MTYNTQTVNLRELTADEGMVITDRETQTLRSKKGFSRQGGEQVELYRD